MCVCGNPPDYILVFGGVTEELIDGSISTVSKIRKTLNDLWVYHTGTRLWQRIFVNSPVMPDAREQAVMVTIKTDRLVLLFGGLNGQIIYDDVWQYSLNSNMWDKITLSERRPIEREFNLQNCTACISCNVCSGLRTKKSNCGGCTDCYAGFEDADLDPVTQSMPCDKCDNCENGDPRYVNCEECNVCTECSDILDTMKPPRLKGHTGIVASQGLIIYGGITWPETDMSISDGFRKKRKEFEEACKKRVEYLV